MEKSTVIILAIITAISFSYALFVYTSIANTLDSKMREYTGSYATSFNISITSAESEGELRAFQSVCMVEDIQNESSKYSTFYIFKAENCDIGKIRDLENSMKSSEEAAVYFSLVPRFAYQDMGKGMDSFVRERYPKESLLLVEKIYDVEALVFNLMFQAISSDVTRSSIAKCTIGEARNGTIDIGCVKALFAAESKSIPVLISRTSFNGFEQKCQRFLSSHKDALSGMINTMDSCSRIKQIANYTYEKSLEDAQGSVHERFIKADFFYELSNMDKDPNVLGNETMLILKNNIAPEYSGKF